MQVLDRTYQIADPYLRRAVSEFMAAYNCWPYQKPDKLFEWFNILDKHRRNRPIKRGSSKVA